MLRVNLMLACLVLALAGCESVPIVDKTTASRALEKGKMRYQEGDFQAANVAFRTYRSGQTDSAKLAEAYYWEGMCFLAQREFLSASEKFGLALEQSPRVWLKAYVLSGLGGAFMGLGMFEEAHDAYLKALDTSTEDIRLDLVYLRLATCAQRLGNWESAEKHLERLISETPNSPFLGQAKEKLQYGKRRFFTVQVGAFKEDEAARKRTAQLKKQGLPAFVAEIERGMERLYCVWIGKFDSWEEANLEMQRIRGKGQIENAIVKP